MKKAPEVQTGTHRPWTMGCEGRPGSEEIHPSSPGYPCHERQVPHATNGRSTRPPRGLDHERPEDPPKPRTSAASRLRHIHNEKRRPTSGKASERGFMAKSSNSETMMHNKESKQQRPVETPKDLLKLTSHIV